LPDLTGLSGRIPRLAGLGPAASSFPTHEDFSPFPAGTSVPDSALSGHVGRLAKRPLITKRIKAMLSWVVTFLIVALIAGVLGFGGVAGVSIEIAKTIFFIAVVLFLISAVVGLARGRTNV
jgi:uncharacterized membrane protein YtjA (UPF0391 family)